MRRSNVWLSIDWDYFCREEVAWDFGHAETEDFKGLLWNMRLKLFREQGMNLIRETSLRHADPHPKDFWKALQRIGYSFDSLKRIVVGDSHQWGYNVFQRSTLEGPPIKKTRIVHFDAHHDLYYRRHLHAESFYETPVNCENWLFKTHISQVELKSIIVYPPWKGMREWDMTLGDSCKKMPAIQKALSSFTKPCVWPDPIVAKAAGSVELVYICRSSAWTPPWHDRAFVKFVHALRKIAGVPLESTFGKVEITNVMEPRRFDPKLAPRETEKLYLARLESHA